MTKRLLALLVVAFATVVLINVRTLVYGQGTYTPPAGGGVPCANQSPTCVTGPVSNSPCPGGPGPNPGPKPCPDEACAGAATSDPNPNCAATGGANLFSAYTGNATRSVKDLTVYGGVGNHKLSLTRASSTRANPQVMSRGAFGKEVAWMHNYQWMLRDSGTYNGYPALQLAFPDGSDIRFVQSDTDPNLLVPPAALSCVLRRNGDDYALETKTGYSYKFHRYTTTSGSVYYRIESFEDDISNVYTFVYSNVTDTTVRKVVDPSGRYLQFTYQDLGPFYQSEATLASVAYDAPLGAWQEIAVTNTGTYRYLALLLSNDYRNTPSLPVGELEFYDINNVKLTGVAFGSEPVMAAGQEKEKAFDGDTSTFYRYSFMRNGYIGLDLGTAKRVAKIRYFVPSGVAGVTHAAAISFVGMNNLANTNYVLKEVKSSDGRAVTYDYTVFQDPGGVFKWGTLSQVNYPDGTHAVYTYEQTHPYTQPILKKAIDPRYDGSGASIEYRFNLEGPLGFLLDETSGVTGELIATAGFDDVHKPKVIYPNGKVKKASYQLTNALCTESTDGTGKKTAYTYDQAGAGFVATRKDALNRVTSFVRNAQSLPTQTTHPDGVVENMTYDARGRVLSDSIVASGYAARTTTHTRDAQGHITRTDYPDGSFETWTYNIFGQVLIYTHKDGGVDAWTYDAAGRKLSFTDEAGAVTTYTYNALDLMASVTDPLGHTTSYLYNDRGQVVKTTYADGTFAVTSYDDFGNVIARTNELGNTWSFTYNEYRQKLAELDPLGRQTTYEYGVAGAGAGSGCSACNTAGKPTRITTPTGKVTTISYDLEWNPLSTTMGAGSVDAATTSYLYDASYRIVRVTDPMGRFTTMTYDTKDRVLSQTDHYARTTTMGYDPFGNVLTVSSPLTGITTKTYDIMDRVLTETNALNQVSSTTYEVEGRPVLQTSPAGRKTRWTYDTVGRILTMTIGADTTEASTTTYAYALDGSQISQTDALNRTTSYSYDVRHRLVTTTDALNRTTTSVYDAAGRATSVQFPDGTMKFTSYDAANQRTSEKDALNQITTSTYDGEGRTLSLTDGKGATRQWVYDILGRVKRKVNPDNTYEENTYLTDGSVASVRTPMGAVCTYTYSLQGLLLSKDWNDGTADVTNTYDAVARLKSTANGASTVSYTYDALSRKAAESQNVSTSTVSYAYDADGNLASLTYPDGHVVEYNYTARNQLAAVTAGGPPPVATYAYDIAGELTSRTLENGVRTGYAYNPAGQATGIAQTLNNVPFDTLGYTLDNRGRRTGITRGNGKNDGYSYDAIGEVIGGAYTATSSGSQTEAFAYDAAGNRLTSARNGANTSYVANANDQYTVVGGKAQTYDANGNNTLAQWSADATPAPNVSIAMTWDSENRMLSSESATARIENGYDALHRRVSKKVYTSNGSGGWNLDKIIVFTYDGWNVIMEKEYAGSSILAGIFRYTWGRDASGSLQDAGGVGGLLMAEEINGATATPHYYCYDGNGNVTHVLDSNGNLEAHHRYTAFGGDLESVTTTAFAQRNPWRFSTKYLDREVESTEGFYYYGYRFYLKALGRWLSRDPIGEKGGVNLYMMVNNSAVNELDNIGLMSMVPTCKLTNTYTLSSQTDYPITLPTTVIGKAGISFPLLLKHVTCAYTGLVTARSGCCGGGNTPVGVTVSSIANSFYWKTMSFTCPATVSSSVNEPYKL